MLARTVLRKSRDESGMKKGRSDEKPRVRIPASTLSGDSVGARSRARMYMETASPEVAARSIIRRILSFSISPASSYCRVNSSLSFEPARSMWFFLN
jgi:hypothetical protein